MARTFSAGSNFYSATAPSATTALNCTFAARVRVTAWGGSGWPANSFVGNVVGVDSTTTNNDRIWIYSDSGQSGKFYFSVQAGTFSDYEEIEVSGLSLNTWYHLALTVDGAGVITAYVDGVATAGTTFSGGAGVSGWSARTWNSILIGDSVGQIQDVAIYTSALSAAAIAQLARFSNPLTRSGLVAQYPLFADTPLPDFSGNGRTLTANGTITAGGSPHAPAPWGGQAARLLFIPASGATNITAAGTTQVTGAATITAAASAASAGTTQVTGTATILALFPVAASGSTQVTGTAVVTSSAGGSIDAAGTTQVTGSATITSAAALAGAGTTQVTGAADLTASAAVAATGTTQVTGIATLSSGAAAAAAGTTQVTGSATLQAAFPLAASGSTQVTGIAFVTSSSPAPTVGAGWGRGTARRFAQSGRRRAR